MKVERVYLKNFKAFEELDLVLNEDDADPPSLIALIGDNGSGKTSILAAIASLCHVLKSTDLGKKPSSAPISPDAHRLAEAETIAEVGLRLSPHEASQLLATPGLPEARLRLRALAYPRSSNRRSSLSATSTLGNDLLSSLHEATTSHRVAWITPSREVAAMKVQQAKLGQEVPREQIANWGFRDLKQHLVDLDYVWLKRKAGGGPDPMEPYRAVVARLFRNKTLEGVDERLRVVFRTDDGIKVDFDQLSSGERGVLALIFSLLRADLRDSVVLIDEPEQHLHPRWQAELPGVFAEQARRFNNQFILATHSVEVAEGVQREGGLVFSLSPPPAVNAGAGGPTQSAAGPA